jgi:predicted RNA-binding Zn-ribbon protein involved in translation (DUF1610 family)
MNEWHVASFCSTCDKEIDLWDLATKDHCPHCHTEGYIMIDHYDRSYRIEVIKRGFLGIGRKTRRIYEEDDVKESSEILMKGMSN